MNCVNVERVVFALRGEHIWNVSASELKHPTLARFLRPSDQKNRRSLEEAENRRSADR